MTIILELLHAIFIILNYSLNFRKDFFAIPNFHD